MFMLNIPLFVMIWLTSEMLLQLQYSYVLIFGSQACSEPDDIKAGYFDPDDGSFVEVPKGGGGVQTYVLTESTGFTCENADQIPDATTGEKQECFDYHVQLCCKGKPI